MTDKETVLAKYPEAVCKKCNKCNLYHVRENGGYRAPIIEEGSTEEKSWMFAAEYINAGCPEDWVW